MARVSLHLALANEGQRAEDRGPALPGTFRAGEFIQHIARPIEQVIADDVGRTQVDQIPVVDPVVPAKIQLEQLALTRSAVVDLAVICLLMIRSAPDSDLVRRGVQQLTSISFGGSAVNCLASSKTSPIRIADEIVAFAGFEVAANLSQFRHRTAEPAVGQRTPRR